MVFRRAGVTMTQLQSQHEEDVLIRLWIAVNQQSSIRNQQCSKQAREKDDYSALSAVSGSTRSARLAGT